MAWGDSNFGGNITQDVRQRIKQGGGVATIRSTDGAFAAKNGIKGGDQWGHKDYGGKMTRGYLSQINLMVCDWFLSSLVS